MPVEHKVASKLPAVSGSSGRLVVERCQTEAGEAQWPGRVFENPELTYEEAMLSFVVASQEDADQPGRRAEAAGQGSLKAEKRALRREEARLRDERRQIREKRRLEDTAWTEARLARKAEEQAYQALFKPERRQQRNVKQARDERWRALRDQRRATLEQRQREDEEWRQKRLELRERWSQLPVVTAWIAILVVIDNCTRQCLGLPLFMAGPKVTSQMIVEALRVLLPPELLFLISDRGTHFTAKAFRKLVLSEEFIHVLIARHRPQSNGIAERFVRTLKEWLADKSWQDDRQLTALLQQFLGEYNDRPHQGLLIPGLSPNEFARRIWLM
ncbi:MAG: integrase core domain-containing protein [Planctomycetota bacterium]